MENGKPILSCAGREAVSIDAALLNGLLLSYEPRTISLKKKAEQLSVTFDLFAKGHYGNENLDEFTRIISEEFLYLQLMKASELAKEAFERSANDV